MYAIAASHLMNVISVYCRVPPPPSPTSSSVVNLHEFMQLSAPKLQVLRPPPLVPPHDRVLPQAGAATTTAATAAASAAAVEAIPGEAISISVPSRDDSSVAALLVSPPQSAGRVMQLESGSLSADGSDARIKSRL